MRIAKLLIGVVLAACLVGVAPAQKAVEAKTANRVYACAKCHVASKTGGKCACGAEMKQIYATMQYGCVKDAIAEKKAGTCPKCKGKEQPVAVTYACENCHTTATKAGNCGKCGKFRKKTVLKVAG
ncbi:MAG: hypothetical protein HONBIEJF_01106 [Fimbriimonadaceae bacterium]|nr:hypothetical protein [Fimbriimonadaceae bacterium]